MLQTIINEFRGQHGVQAVYSFDDRVSNFCFNHCLAMAHRNDIYHAEPCYLEGWGEAVAMMSYQDGYETTLKKIIYDVFGQSEQHKNLLLSSNVMAIGTHISHYRIFVTIRGKRG